MARYLMTHSLVSSWLYVFSDFEKYIHDESEKTAEDYQQAAQRDFLATLRREPTTTTEAMQNGIDLENLVASVCAGEPQPEHKWLGAAREIAQEVAGGQFQVPVQKDIEVSGLQILLYGRIDCLKAGNIIDIKYTSKYEAGKYYGSPQHHFYMEMAPEAGRFTYLVSNGSRVWREDYAREECRPAAGIIGGFLEYLKTAGLLATYMENWRAKE